MLVPICRGGTVPVSKMLCYICCGVGAKQTRCFQQESEMGRQGPFLKLLALLAAPWGRSVRRHHACPCRPRPACSNSPRVFAKPAPRLLPAEGQSLAARSKPPSSACSGRRQEVPILCQPPLEDSQERLLMPMLVQVLVLVWVPVPVQVLVRGSGKAEVRSV